MLIRDYLSQELKSIFTGLTINSKSIQITDIFGKAKDNFLFCYLGDETNAFALNDVQNESGTSIAFELILETKTNDSPIAIQNEAIEKIKICIMKYRKTMGRRYDNSDFYFEIQDIFYNNIYAPESTNDRVVMLMIQGEFIINQIYKEA